MEDQKKAIVEAALGMFNRYGIRSVTMDDLSSELSISKKTLYKFFDNKADLVHQCGELLFEKIYSSLMEIHENAESAIDELFQVDEVVWRMMEGHNPGMRYQIQKYYPKTFDHFFQGRKEMIQKLISENIERGKADGCFRKDADTNVISYLYCSKVESMPEEESEFLDRRSMRYVSRQALIYHIRGLATPQGLAKLEEILKTYPLDEN